ncbi:hypothetical protein RHMOL_Rhmol01G0101400 [Rhododendron molle]|uniref:Uncharacterized protein n=1 Tax=Rhododendron molle TaxID=49168 RepID=A0ACC0Q1E2_RHOML|nr:hypothetical protein RHMOL_Rhmol01G0101400 [Rhododendron molle]
MGEAEVFSPRKLQWALKLTVVVFKNQEAVANEGSDAGMSNLSFRMLQYVLFLLSSSSCRNGQLKLSIPKGTRKKSFFLSNHQHVTGTDMDEAEVFAPRKLQWALTLTDAELKNQEAVANEGSDAGMSNLSFRKFELGFIEMMDMEIGFK